MIDSFPAAVEAIEKLTRRVEVLEAQLAGVDDFLDAVEPALASLDDDADQPSAPDGQPAPPVEPSPSE